MANPTIASTTLIHSIAFCVSMAWAADCRSADDRDYRFNAGLSLTMLHYKEFSNDGKLLDREDGYLPGLHFGAKLFSPPYVLIAHVAGHRNTIAYRGQTQSGIPLKTDTTESVVQYSLAVKRDLSAGTDPSGLIFELGQRDWRRDIHKTSSTDRLYEAYRWPYFRIGGMLSIRQQDNFNVGIQILAGRAFNSTLEVHISGYDTSTLELDNGTTLMLTLPVTIADYNDRDLRIEPYVEYWRFGRSRTGGLYLNGSQTGQLYEPQNNTLSYGIILSIQL